MLSSRKEIIAWLKKMEVHNYTLNEDLTVDGHSTVYLNDKGLTEIPVQFNYVDGSFFCHKNQLTSLKGSPIALSGGFYCQYNNLTSLEGIPVLLNEVLDCSFNKLSSLKDVHSVSGQLILTGNNLNELEEITCRVKENIRFSDIDNKIMELSSKEFKEYHNMLKLNEKLQKELTENKTEAKVKL